MSASALATRSRRLRQYFSIAGALQGDPAGAAADRSIPSSARLYVRTPDGVLSRHGGEPQAETVTQSINRFQQLNSASFGRQRHVAGEALKFLRDALAEVARAAITSITPASHASSCRSRRFAYPDVRG